jgi:hypothetical protein
LRTTIRPTLIGWITTLGPLIATVWPPRAVLHSSRCPQQPPCLVLAHDGREDVAPPPPPRDVRPPSHVPQAGSLPTPASAPERQNTWSSTNEALRSDRRPVVAAPRARRPARHPTRRRRRRHCIGYAKNHVCRRRVKRVNGEWRRVTTFADNLVSHDRGQRF